MKKTIAKIISVAIALICVAGLTVMITFGAESEPVLNIEGFNLSFSDSVYIEYAVSYENTSDVKLLVWTNPAAEFVKGTETAVLSPAYSATVNEKECKVFDYKDLAAKQMTDNVYARAYVEKGGVGYYSDVTKYSVLQYVYNKLGKTGVATTNEDLKALLTDMLEYGASAQKYFCYKTDRLVTADFVQVKVVGGVLDDGSSCGLYLAGEQVKLTAPSVNAEGVAFDHWENSAGANVGTTAELTVTVGDKNEVYTAVYEANTEITYTVVFKDWDGTELKKEIVKAGESATAPAGPSRSGYRFTGWDVAFNNIKSNTTVTAQYIQQFTVTFKDYDGSTLKTQTIDKGSNATPPANPSRDGYEFTSWSGTYTNVTANQVVTATYTQLVDTRNLLEMTYVDNQDGTLTLTVAVKGNVVNFAGIEGYVSFDTSKLTFSSRSKLSSLSGSVNYDSSDSNVYFSLADSENLTEAETLFCIILTYADAINTQITLTITDIYDQDYNTETYTVVGGNVVIG